MKAKNLAGAAAMALGALAIGAVVGRPGTGQAAGASPPTNTGTPTISGTPQEGETLTTSNGTWSSSSTPTYKYAWKRCDKNGNGCAAIAGATTSKY